MVERVEKLGEDGGSKNVVSAVFIDDSRRKVYGGWQAQSLWLMASAVFTVDSKRKQVKEPSTQIACRNGLELKA